MATTHTSFDVDALRQALESSDADMLTSLFRDDAECVVIDKNSPPSGPMERRGKEEIREFNEFLMGPGKTHHLEKLVATDDTVAWADACRYDDGTRVFCMAFMDIDGDKVSRSVCIQAWDE